MGLKDQWKTWALGAAAFVAAAGIITSSKPFQACVKEQKYHYSYRHLHDGSGSLIKSVVRLKLNIACTLSDSDALVALSGVAVAFFTFTLWRSTHRLYEAGERQIAVAKQAANAATMAANASMVQERPHLFLSLNREAVGYVEPGRVMFPRIEYAFMNYGRSPAIIDRYYIEMKRAKGVQEFTESNHLRAYFDRIILPNASTGKLYIEVVPPLSEADREEILTGSISVFLYGWIKYGDVFGGHRTRYYAMVYDPRLDRFLEHPSAKHNQEVEDAPLPPAIVAERSSLPYHRT